MKRTTPIGVLLLLALLVSVSGCASVAPGNDPVVVNAQKGLAAADQVYDALMKFYFANSATLPVNVKGALERVRTGYDPAYKAAQSALSLYQSGKAKDFGDTFANLRHLLSDGAAVAKAFGLDLFGKFPWLAGVL